MLPALTKAANTRRKISTAPSQRALTPFDPDELSSGERSKQRNVLMRAGVYTVQAEGTIHVADFLRLEELQLAAALFVVTAETIVRLTSSADIEAAYTYLHRGNERVDE